MEPSKILEELNHVIHNKKVVGYSGDQEVRPYNLLPLPRLCLEDPECLSGESTKIYQTLRHINPAPRLPAPEDPYWTVLAPHIAFELSHQDRGGLRKWVRGLFGYRIYYFYLRISDTSRSHFRKQRNNLARSKA